MLESVSSKLKLCNNGQHFLGVTPLSSILKTIRQVRRTPQAANRIQQIDLVWMTRDQDSFDWFGDLLHFFQNQWDVFTYHLFLTSRNSADLRSVGFSLLVGDVADKKSMEFLITVTFTKFTQILWLSFCCVSCFF